MTLPSAPLESNDKPESPVITEETPEMMAKVDSIKEVEPKKMEVEVVQTIMNET
jgi:hypothetical protein